MALTVSQIVGRAARELGKNPTGQPVSGAVSADLTQAYNEVWSMLNRKNLVTWGKTEDIPDEYCNPMTYLVANQRKSGLSNERFQRIAMEATSAIGTIKSIKDGIWENATDVEDF